MSTARTIVQSAWIASVVALAATAAITMGASQFVSALHLPEPLIVGLTLVSAPAVAIGTFRLTFNWFAERWSEAVVPPHFPPLWTLVRNLLRNTVFSGS